MKESEKAEKDVDKKITIGSLFSGSGGV